MFAHGTPICALAVLAQLFHDIAQEIRACRQPLDRRALAVTGRRHDFIALRIEDERERYFPNVGLITLEDAETGEQIEINTAHRATRERLNETAERVEAELSRVLRRNNVDSITLRTGEDYLPALRAFFKQRERRLAIR